MGCLKRSSILLLWLVLVFIFINVDQCQGSRSNTNVFKLNPKPKNYGHFGGFLPRRIPIPASGPSRKHNEIGLQSWRSP
ncbi:hypothetical protein LguiA_003902 [Lonicera macranthoides]